MKDLELNRMIHVAAAGVLALSVVNCGGKKDKDEDGPAPKKSEALEEFCEASRICAEAQFNAEYEDIDACIEDSSQNYDEVVADYGEECGKSMRRLLYCFGKEWADTCDEYAAAEECLGEALGAYNDCDGLVL